MNKNSLDWTEYLAVTLSLVVSIGLSVWTYRTTKSTDYFRSRISIVAITCSLIASSTSGVSLLGKPAEIYEHGTGFYVAHTLTSIFVTVFSNEIFLPVLYQLDCSSLYQYFELRFDRKVKTLVTIVFTLTKICYTAVMLLSPAIVLQQFSGIDINITIAAVAFITIFYTMLGGFKGVVWTDTIQGFIMMIGMIILGTISVFQVGGIGRLFEISYQNNRLNFPKMSVDPTERIPVWSYGIFLYALTSVNVNQPTYQRLKCTASLKEAKLASWFQAIGMMFFGTFSSLIGLSIYAYYYGCDPKTAGLVDSYSNLIVYWMDEIGRSIRGFRGVYLACIVCASISSISTNVNALAGLIVSELSSSKTSSSLHCQRSVSVAVGVAVTTVAISMTGSKSLLELSHLSLTTDGIIAGLFILGMLVVPANTKGALTGGLTTLILILFLSFARLISPTGPVQKINEYMKTDDCSFNVTQKRYLQANHHEDTFILLRISPFTTGVFTVFLTVSIGILVSMLSPDKSANVNPELYSSLVRKFLPSRRTYESVPCNIIVDKSSS